MKDRDELPSWTTEPLKNVENYLFQEWVPQTTVLSSGKVKVFLTHGGMNSIYEAIESKVPLLALPTGTHDLKINCEWI